VQFRRLAALWPSRVGSLYHQYVRVNAPWEYNEGVFEPSFHPYHFRPLVQHKTDISVFTRMLDNVRTKEHGVVQMNILLSLGACQLFIFAARYTSPF
jgi:hypothetical protein